MRPTRWCRVALLGAVVVLVSGIASPAGAQSDQELALESTDASRFPLMSAVVSGPPVSGELDDAFTVVEDGEEVTADVIRVRGDDLNVVIAIDVSGSMEGEPLARAKAAVGDLLATLPETVPVSVISFGDTANVHTPFIVDRTATQVAVDGLIAAGQTALYDGVAHGLAELEAQGGSSALVVLADGDDSASARTLDDVVSQVGASDTVASFVALQTEDFTEDAVRALADASGGDVLAVDDADQFANALESIGAGLGNVYELRWRSSSEGDSAAVEISLASDPSRSVSTEVEHAAVRQFVPDVATDSRTVEGAGVFDNGWIPLVAALLVSAGGFYLVVAIRNSEGAVERREERSHDRGTRKQERRRRMAGMQEALEGISAQMLEVNNRGRSLDDTLDRAGLSVRANEFVVACAAITLASLLVGVLVFGIPFFLLALLFPVLGIPITLRILSARRRKAFVNQLGDTLQLMVGSLTAGYGLGQTIDSVSREAESPTSEEFARVVMETRLGRSLEDALDAMSERIRAPDFEWVVDAIKIQASVGGDLAEIIEQVGETIRARTRIKRQVDALTAEGKISALVLFCLPFGLAGFIASSNFEYIEPLFSPGRGYAMLGAALVMMLVGGLWLRKLVNPEF